MANDVEMANHTYVETVLSFTSTTPLKLMLIF